MSSAPTRLALNTINGSKHESHWRNWHCEDEQGCIAALWVVPSEPQNAGDEDGESGAYPTDAFRLLRRYCVPCPATQQVSLVQILSAGTIASVVIDPRCSYLPPRILYLASRGRKRCASTACVVLYESFPGISFAVSLHPARPTTSASRARRPSTSHRACAPPACAVGVRLPSIPAFRTSVCAPFDTAGDNTAGVLCCRCCVCVPCNRSPATDGR
ncbi:hypothetical protein C8R47DRAFT_710537 [Mycena vitilis]|nr:hypothetical protein C8R47DRAFT_710537 [Mycena vitilis]